MTTMIELTKKARDLKLTGYSGLRKPALEKMIDDELRRRENIRLAEIRNAPSDGATLPPLDPFIPTQPLDLEPEPFAAEPVKGKGLTNRERIRRYLAQTPGRKFLTEAQARQVRKNFNAGDYTVPVACNYAGTFNVRSFL